MSPKIAGYWNTGSKLGPTHPTILRSMSLDRFRQIGRYLRISSLPRSAIERLNAREVRAINKGQTYRTRLDIDDEILVWSHRVSSAHFYGNLLIICDIQVESVISAYHEASEKLEPPYTSIWLLFHYIQNRAVYKAYRISRVQARVCERRIHSQRRFVEALKDELLRQNQTGNTKKRKYLGDFELPIQRLDHRFAHNPVRVPRLRWCAWCLHTSKRQRGRQSTVGAGYTSYECKDCKVPLCWLSSGQCCWSEFHEKGCR